MAEEDEAEEEAEEERPGSAEHNRHGMAAWGSAVVVPPDGFIVVGVWQGDLWKRENGDSCIF